MSNKWSSMKTAKKAYTAEGAMEWVNNPNQVTANLSIPAAKTGFTVIGELIDIGLRTDWKEMEARPAVAIQTGKLANLVIRPDYSTLVIVNNDQLTWDEEHWISSAPTAFKPDKSNTKPAPTEAMIAKANELEHITRKFVVNRFIEGTASVSTDLRVGDTVTCTGYTITPKVMRAKDGTPDPRVNYSISGVSLFTVPDNTKGKEKVVAPVVDELNLVKFIHNQFTRGMHPAIHHLKPQDIYDEPRQFLIVPLGVTTPESVNRQLPAYVICTGWCFGQDSKKSDFATSCVEKEIGTTVKTKVNEMTLMAWGVCKQPEYQDLGEISWNIVVNANTDRLADIGPMDLKRQRDLWSWITEHLLMYVLMNQDPKKTKNSTEGTKDIKLSKTFGAQGYAGHFVTDIADTVRKLGFEVKRNFVLNMRKKAGRGGADMFLDQQKLAFNLSERSASKKLFLWDKLTYVSEAKEIPSDDDNKFWLLAAPKEHEIIVRHLLKECPNDVEATENPSETFRWTITKYSPTDAVMNAMEALFSGKLITGILHVYAIDKNGTPDIDPQDPLTLEEYNMQWAKIMDTRKRLFFSGPQQSKLDKFFGEKRPNEEENETNKQPKPDFVGSMD